MYNKLQYISQGNTIENQLHNIHEALDAGCDWIQMRFKNQTQKDSFALAEAVKPLCEQYLANFIVNDNLQLAKDVNADGVHLGAPMVLAAKAAMCSALPVYSARTPFIVRL